MASENAGQDDFVAVVLDIDTPAGVSFTVAHSETEESTGDPSISPWSVVGTSQPSKQMSPTTSTRGTDINTLVLDPTPAPTTASHWLIPAATTSPAMRLDTLTSLPANPPTSTPTTDGVPYYATTLWFIFSSTVAFVLMVGAFWRYRRQCQRAGDVFVAHVCDRVDGPRDNKERANPPLSPDVRTQHSSKPRHFNDSFSALAETKEAVNEGSSAASSRTVMKPPAMDGGVTPRGSVHLNAPGSESSGETPDDGIPEGHSPSSSIVAKGGAELPPVLDKGAVDSIAEIGERGNSRAGDCQKPIRGFGVAQAVMGVAHDLAQMSQIPGVTEVAGLVIVLMNLVTDNSDNVDGIENTVKRCRSVVTLLQRAASVLQHVSVEVFDDVKSALDQVYGRGIILRDLSQPHV